MAAIVTLCIVASSNIAFSAYPDGTLIRERAGGMVYEVRNGRKFPLVDARKLSKGTIVEVSAEELVRIPNMPLQMQYGDGPGTSGATAYGGGQFGSPANMQPGLPGAAYPGRPIGSPIQYGAPQRAPDLQRPSYLPSAQPFAIDPPRPNFPPSTPAVSGVPVGTLPPPPPVGER